MPKLRTGHYVGDPTAPRDPGNVVEADGLTQNQREWLGKIERGHQQNVRNLPWTKCYREGRWWTRAEWDARVLPERVAPAISSFQEEWYPALGRRVSSPSELKRLMAERGLQPKF